MSRNTSTPPRWVLRFLRAICPESLVEEIEGDLLQKFERDKTRHGERRANRRLIWAALRFFRPGILLRNSFTVQSNALAILANYFKTTYRHISKSKVNFTFKLGGLTLALFSFLVIALFVSYQLSFDRFHADYEKIYRVNTARNENGQSEKYGIAPMAFGPLLKQHFPEIAAFTRIQTANGTYIRTDNNVTDCEVLLADSSLFDVLTFSFLSGGKDALKKPNGIVLTRRAATIIFGTADALGKLLSINHEKQVYEVTAVVEDFPPNSHLSINAIIPIRQEHDLNLSSINSPTDFAERSACLFLKFHQASDAQAFTLKIETLLDAYIKKSDRVESGFSVSLQPIKDIYLDAYYKFEIAQKGNATYVYAFSVLGVLLLLVAGINYINLSIADFNGRSRETGVRKVLGARKRQLVVQVALETILYSAVALVLSVLLLYVLFPQVLMLLESHLRLNMLLDRGVVMIVAMGLITLLVFASYFPARQYTTTAITQNLKSKGASYNSSLSRGLLFVQFTISIICLCCTLTMQRQIHFIHTKALGFDRNNLLVLSMPEDFDVKKMQALKQGVKSIAAVTGVSNSSFRISGGYWKDWYTVEVNGEMKSMELYEVFSDDELFSTLGIKLLQGRTFRADMPADSGAAFVINETAMRELGWKDPIGKRIFTHPEEKGKWDGTVVGVVNDIHINELYEKVRPLVMRLPWQNVYPEYFVYVRYVGDAPTVVKAIEKKYRELMPGYPLAYRFVDELYNSSHAREDKAFATLEFSTFVILIVSLLGIFSLSVYLSIRRMKEFGIRKVLGATTHQIAVLHIGYFLRIVLLANAVALPLAYWLMTEWLSVFAYRTPLNGTLFFVVAGISFPLVIASAGYSAWKAGRMNPVDVIKT
ncbi:FtsX-like permease family protein [Chryseolinea lacunae]|uniref:ABC transporter permease n=1 Tax=Chryseolinea lacunae TaxID=2801331 RepID=A0ABS1KVZ3_9BACT|nr:FtsX-like permease family protein [Chryseolinea lacunae]MBL0743574.1 ABC transporter permease [Chryseolinea lacunae]